MNVLFMCCCCFFFVCLSNQDGLYLVTQEPGVIENYKKAVLTPNEVEFARLFRKVVSVK